MMAIAPALSCTPRHRAYTPAQTPRASVKKHRLFKRIRIVASGKDSVFLKRQRFCINNQTSSCCWPKFVCSNLQTCSASHFYRGSLRETTLKSPSFLFPSSSSSSSPSSVFASLALPSQGFSAITDESLNETRRLVETAMLAAAAGLAYFLSNTFKIENYFGCFFPLPLVVSSLRWGITAGRKTMVATGMLLLVLSGPLKAATYLLMHGFLGLTMGALWRSKVSWGTSLLICTLVRSMGAMGFVFLTSWLIRENLLKLITINAHASISLLLAAMGVEFVPSMGLIYFIFGSLVLLNCGTFVFILHLLYAIFLKRMELNTSVIFPSWLKAL
ncbi:hypothetical protein KP509_26G052900 [Ceratopteris richardii]|uniref:Uncharacterized protein n=1 Tax=Ceratopteris richardii TaxID=49495 RepID=A0A8T2RKY9_CERRI|nr:hypothetical protein KP509_26G052900 [Ceratopteris richardii]